MSEKPDGKANATFPEWQYASEVVYLWNSSTARDVIEHIRVDVWRDYRHYPWVRPAAISSDFSTPATSSPPSGITVWDTRTGRPVTHVPMSSERGRLGTGIVSQLVFSPDGRTFLTTSFDEQARVWHAVTGAGATLTVDDWGAAPAAVFASNGHRLLLSAAAGTAVLDVSTGQVLWKIGHHGRSDALPAAAISPDGSMVAVGFPGDGPNGYTDIFRVN
jgi:WD40 repeat protein